jgi:hypothetical protein
VIVRLARIVGVLAAMTAVAVAPAGCGTADSRGPRVATVQGTPSAAPGQPSPSPSPQESDYDKALRYTRCMNEHGVQMADPVEGTPLELRARPDAFDRCKRFLPETWPVKLDPGEIARSRGFTDCLRKRGQYAPEPDANGMLHLRTDYSYMYTPEYEAALRACRHLLDDPANDLPENQN